MGKAYRYNFFYHGDHLGSSNYITDRTGRVFEHTLYLPYGETWIDEGHDTSLLGYKFTGKELDEETGLYYFGARYYDPQISNWISTDPALSDYLPTGAQLYFPDQAFNANSLKGAGGVFNSKNINVYHYASLNPIKNIDSNGEWTEAGVKKFLSGSESGRAALYALKDVKIVLLTTIEGKKISLGDKYSKPETVEGVAFYDKENKTIQLNNNQLSDASDADMAATLVHELTHHEQSKNGQDPSSKNSELNAFIKEAEFQKENKSDFKNSKSSFLKGDGSINFKKIDNLLKGSYGFKDGDARSFMVVPGKPGEVIKELKFD